MGIYRTDTDTCQAAPERGYDSSAEGTRSETGHTYCVMALPENTLLAEAVSAKHGEMQERIVRAEYVPRRPRRKSRPLARMAMGLLLTAAMITMPLWLTTDGMLPVMKRLSAASLSVQLPEENIYAAVSSSEATQTVQPATTASTTSTSVPAPTTTTAVPPEGMLPVEEKHLGNSGTRVGDIYVKNSTGYTPDFASLLKSRADCRIKLNAGYQVLIVHTHTTECYAQRSDGVYSPDYSPRTTDSSKSVVAVGEVLTQKLEAAGIRTLHATEVHDHPQYNGSYDRELETIEKYLREYPSIEMVLDVHRDAITYDDGTKLKPTALINDNKAAQVMIISGCDAGGKLYFPGWENNLTMALQIQQSAQKLYPGLMRPLNFAPYRYNMHMTPNSLLLEFGTDANTLDEALYSAELMGEALAKVLLEYDVAA